LGGFDEEYVNGGEDVDLCMKVNQLSGCCWLVPASNVWHHVSQTRGRQEDRDKKNSWRLFSLWQKQIGWALERSCAQLLANTGCEDPLIQRIVTEFITGSRSFAPISVKVMAQRYVKAQLASFDRQYHSGT
jgi:hypothetical protein